MQVVFVNLVVVRKDAPTHDVEERIGKVMRRTQTIARHLQAVSAGDDGDKVLGTSLDVFFEPCLQLSLVAPEQVVQRDNAAMVLVNISHDVPLSLLSRC